MIKTNIHIPNAIEYIRDLLSGTRSTPRNCAVLPTDRFPKAKLLCDNFVPVLHFMRYDRPTLGTVVLGLSLESQGSPCFPSSHFLVMWCRHLLVKQGRCHCCLVDRSITLQAIHISFNQLVRQSINQALDQESFILFLFALFCCLVLVSILLLNQLIDRFDHNEKERVLCVSRWHAADMDDNGRYHWFAKSRTIGKGRTNGKG